VGHSHFAGGKLLIRRFAASSKVVNVLIILMIWFPWAPASARGADAWLAPLTTRIPKRPQSALTGSQFVDLVSQMDEHQREQVILEQLLEGNLPAFLRKLKPVHLQYRFDNGRLVSATIFVTPDYLAIGSQSDFIRIPMNYHTASTVATQFGFILPTRKIVNAIYEQSAYHFTPQPMTPGPQMRSTAYYQQHNRKIAQQRVSHHIPLGELVAGHKKDVVITNRLTRMPGRIAIYGWHQPTGIPIQPLSTVHGAGYADYSHGIRLVSEVVLIDGKIRSVYDVLQDPQLASLLTDEGPISQLPQILGIPAWSARLRLVSARH
jgi:hypothetical protein